MFVDQRIIKMLDLDHFIVWFGDGQFCSPVHDSPSGLWAHAWLKTGMCFRNSLQAHSSEQFSLSHW